MDAPDKPGYGIAFTNRKTMDTHPDYRGAIRIDKTYQEGDEIRIAMWVKQGKNGPYFGIKIDNQRAYNTGTPGVPRPTPRDNPMQRVKSAPSTQKQARAHDDLDEDVPF
jgi:hypothetical protein